MRFSSLFLCLAAVTLRCTAATGVLVPSRILQTAGDSNSFRPPGELIDDAIALSYSTPVGATEGWHTNSGTTATFEISFSQSRTLTQFHLWNYNHATTWTMGVKDFTLEVSPDAAGDTFTPAGSFAARGTANNSTVESFPLAAENVRRVRWKILGNHGYSEMVGASEIGFSGELPPPVFADLGSGWDLPEDPENFHIFLLMGQSNMAGYALLQAGDTDPQPGIVVLDGQGTVDSSTPVGGAIEWRRGAHRLHLVQESGRFGLGMDFAKAYLASHPGVLVGLVPCAWGGEEISHLNRGSAIYTNAMARAEYAANFGRLRGVLWHQGESDSVNATLADAYQGKLHQFILDLRSDLHSPDLPFVAGELGQFYYPSRSAAQQPNIIKVQNILNALPTFDGLTACVKTAGLTDVGDRVHFDRTSYIELGKRYAAAMMALQEVKTDVIRLRTSATSGHRLEWTPRLQRFYRVEYSSTLAAGSWIEIASNRSVEFIDTDPSRMALPRGFYRIEAME